MAWSIKQRAEFLEILTGLCEIYDKQLSEKGMSFYIAVLEQYDFEDVKRALARYMYNAGGNGSFFPKPADIVSLIEGDPDDRAEQAWTEVLQALERVGTWKSIKFRDPIINAVIYELGGWIYFGEKTMQELEYLHHQFVKLYRHYVRTGKVPKVTHLVGRIESLNARIEWKNHSELVIFGSELPRVLAVNFTKIPAIEKKKSRELSQLENLEQKEEVDKKIDSGVVKNIFSQMLKSLDKEFNFPS